ncbi:MAG: DUF1841 family protein [Firmicutes bacterium]|nr:DUF1841 family protein [Bacillota bacterium]
MRLKEIAECPELDIDTEESAISAVLAEHPDLRILWEKYPVLTGEIVINEVNPIFHVYVEAVAETQIQTGSPPEAKEAFERLKRAGLSGHAARASIAGLIVWYIYHILKEETRFDREEYARLSTGRPLR